MPARHKTLMGTLSAISLSELWVHFLRFPLILQKDSLSRQRADARVVAPCAYTLHTLIFYFIFKKSLSFYNMFCQVCTIEPSFFNMTLGMHRHLIGVRCLVGYSLLFAYPNKSFYPLILCFWGVD